MKYLRGIFLMIAAGAAVGMANGPSGSLAFSMIILSAGLFGAGVASFLE